MSGILIRRAGREDIDALAELDRECFPDPWSRESYRQEMEENRLAYYLIALDGKRAVGYAGLWMIVDEGHITNVAVIPEERGRHIASDLLERLIRETSRLGTCAYTLEVRKSNEAAIGLYERFGFSVEGMRPKYYESDGEDALIMWMRLQEKEDK